MTTSPIRPDEGEQPTYGHSHIDDLEIEATIAQVLDRWP